GWPMRAARFGSRCLWSGRRVRRQGIAGQAHRDGKNDRIRFRQFLTNLLARGPVEGAHLSRPVDRRRAFRPLTAGYANCGVGLESVISARSYGGLSERAISPELFILVIKYSLSSPDLSIL